MDVGSVEATEQGFERWRGSDEFDDFVKNLSRGNRGAAIDLLVGAVVTMATGTPVLGAGAKELHRWLRRRAEAATARLQNAYVQLQNERGAQRQQVAFAKLVKSELQPWFVLTLEQFNGLRSDVDEINETTQRTEAKIDAQRAVLEQVLLQVGTEKGVPLEPLRRILERLGEVGIPHEQIPDRLEAKATELLSLREQLATSSITELGGIRNEVRSRIDSGDLAGARTLAAAARQHWRACRESDARNEAALLSDEAAIDELELRYPAAAQKWRAAAELVSFDDNARTGFLERSASALHVQGDDLGDNDALREAIAIRRALVPMHDRDSAPLEWAAAVHRLGVSLAALGDRERETDHLEEAVAAYRSALLETRERDARLWAATQTNLGNVLLTLGKRENSTARLIEAVAAQRAALAECTRERAPEVWAVLQNNLGITLKAIGEREPDSQCLSEAVVAFRSVLLEWNQQEQPRLWAMALTNLASVLAELGDRERQPTFLEEAEVAFRSALREITRERLPMEWAGIQLNLGNVLRILGDHEGDIARLEQAANAFRLASLEWTRERAPLRWGQTQANLGNALASLGELGAEPSRLKEAADACEAALLECSRDRVPLDWALIQNTLGTVLRELGQITADVACTEGAVDAFNAAMLEWSRENAPLRWAALQNNLGLALQTLGDFAQEPCQLRGALSCFESALLEATESSAPGLHRLIQKNVARTLHLLRRMGA